MQEKILLYKVYTHLDAFLRNTAKLLVWRGAEFTALFLKVTLLPVQLQWQTVLDYIQAFKSGFTELLTGALWGSITLSNNDVSIVAQFTFMHRVR